MQSKDDEGDKNQLTEDTDLLRDELKEKENLIKKLRQQIGTSTQNKFDDMQQEVEILEEKVKELTDELDANKIIERAQKSEDEKILKLESELEAKTTEFDSLEKKCLKYKTLLDEKYKDYEKLKLDYENNFKELIIARERQNMASEVNKVRYYRKKLEEKNFELNTLKRKRMSQTTMRKSYGDFDGLFKKVRQKSATEADRAFSRPKFQAY